MNEYSVKFDIKNIVFDLGNVLIPFDHGRWAAELNKIEAGLGDKMMQKFKENFEFQMQYESGKISDEEFINTYLNWMGNGISSDRFREIYSDIFSFNHDVIDLLPELKKEYNLILLSNTCNIHKVHAWGKYPFIQYFDKLILSHEVGAVKPERKIYRAVEEFTKSEPRTHIFIDDIREYVDTAKSLGWDGIHFTGYENLVDEFKSRDIIG